MARKKQRDFMAEEFSLEPIAVGAKRLAGLVFRSRASRLEQKIRRVEKEIALRKREAELKKRLGELEGYI